MHRQNEHGVPTLLAGIVNTLPPYCVFQYILPLLILMFYDQLSQVPCHTFYIFYQFHCQLYVYDNFLYKEPGLELLSITLLFNL